MTEVGEKPQETKGKEARQNLNKTIKSPGSDEDQ